MLVSAGGGNGAGEASTGNSSSEESNPTNAGEYFSCSAGRGTKFNGGNSTVALAARDAHERYCKMCGVVVMAQSSEQLKYWWNFHWENHKQMHRVGKGHWEDIRGAK